jgi:hypothetical protein
MSFAAEKTALVVSDRDKLPEVLDGLAKATAAGELDEIVAKVGDSKAQRQGSR